MTNTLNNNSQKLKEFMNDNLSEIYNNLSDVYDPDQHELTIGDFLASWVTRESLRDYVLSGSNTNRYMPSEFDIERASDVLFNGGIIIFEDMSIDDGIHGTFENAYPSTFVYLQDGDIKHYNDTCDVITAKWDKESYGVRVNTHERALFLLNLIDKDKDATEVYNNLIDYDSKFHKMFEVSPETSYIDIRTAGLTYDDFLSNNMIGEGLRK